MPGCESRDVEVELPCPRLQEDLVRAAAAHPAQMGPGCWPLGELIVLLGYRLSAVPVTSQRNGGEGLSEAAVPLDELTATGLRHLADRLLETTRVEYVDEGVLLVMNPLGFEHRRIVRSIVASLNRAYPPVTQVDWSIYSADFQWDLPDGSGRFYVPDVVVVHPDARTREEERAAIALVVEVTSPSSPDTVLNDRETKPRQYAKAGVPLYLLVDQELTQWALYALAEGWQRYQVAAGGKIGEPIALPPPFGFEIATADWPLCRD
jgi:Uma2 family endonuclease